MPDDKVNALATTLDDAFRPLKEAMKAGTEEGFKLFEKYDDLTVRDYLVQEMSVSKKSLWLLRNLC